MGSKNRVLINFIFRKLVFLVFSRIVLLMYCYHKIPSGKHLVFEHHVAPFPSKQLSELQAASSSKFIALLLFRLQKTKNCSSISTEIRVTNFCRLSDSYSQPNLRDNLPCLLDWFSVGASGLQGIPLYCHCMLLGLGACSWNQCGSKYRMWLNLKVFARDLQEILYIDLLLVSVSYTGNVVLISMLS